MIQVCKGNQLNVFFNKVILLLWQKKNTCLSSNGFPLHHVYGLHNSETWV